MERPQRSTVDGMDVLTIIRPNTTKTVMLLHGYGANYEDLAPLAQYLDRGEKWNWIFPNAILDVPMGGYMSGRAWFPMRMADIEAAAMRGQTLDFTAVLPDGMKEAEKRLCSLISSMRLDPENLVLGGFSQGAMMTVQTAINLPKKVKGMMLFSAALINRDEWAQKLNHLSGIPLIQSHGRSDQILGFVHAERLNQILMDAQVKGEWLPFNGGHEIPLPVIQKAAALLQSLS